MDVSPFVEYGAIGIAALLAVILVLLLRDNSKERKEMRGELSKVITNFSLVIQNHLEHQRMADVERTEAQVKQTVAMESLTEKIGALCEMWRR